jgi:hypothetical protein
MDTKAKITIQTIKITRIPTTQTNAHSVTSQAIRWKNVLQNFGHYETRAIINPVIIAKGRQVKENIVNSVKRMATQMKNVLHSKKLIRN